MPIECAMDDDGDDGDDLNDVHVNTSITTTRPYGIRTSGAAAQRKQKRSEPQNRADPIR